MHSCNATYHTAKGETRMARTTTPTLDSPTAGEGTGTTPGESTHPLAEAGTEAGQRATYLVERGAEIGLKQADRGLDQAVDGIETVAGSIRRVSADLETEQPQMADFASGAADQAEAVAGYLRETDVRQLIGNVEDFARRQPLLFIGGAFLVGVAASRFVKAAGGPGQAHGGQQPRLRTGNGTGTSHPTTGNPEWAPTPVEGY
jgi:hypothetical protein